MEKPVAITAGVLASCRARDASANISSVLRDGDGRTVIRVSVGQNPMQALRAMREAFPFANTKVVENALNGEVEAEIVVPTSEDQCVRAYGYAKSERHIVWISRTLVILACAFVFQVVNANVFKNSEGFTNE